MCALYWVSCSGRGGNLEVILKILINFIKFLKINFWKSLNFFYKIITQKAFPHIATLPWSKTERNYNKLCCHQLPYCCYSSSDLSLPIRPSVIIHSTFSRSWRLTLMKMFVVLTLNWFKLSCQHRQSRLVVATYIRKLITSHQNHDLNIIIIYLQWRQFL